MVSFETFPGKASNDGAEVRNFTQQVVPETVLRTNGNARLTDRGKPCTSNHLL